MKNIKRLLVLFAAALIAGTTYAYERSTTQDEMLIHLNGYRASQGVAMITGNDSLMKAAQDYACKLDAANAPAPLQHVEASGITPQDRMIAAGYRGVAFGENLNKGTTGASTSAMSIYSRSHSPAHKAAMLNTTFDEVGVGQCGKVRVQNFGTSRKTFNYPMQHDGTSYDTESTLRTTGMDIQRDFDRDYTMIRNGIRIYFEPRVEKADANPPVVAPTNTSTNTLTVRQQKLLDRLNKIYAKIFNGKKLYLK